MRVHNRAHHGNVGGDPGYEQGIYALLLQIGFEAGPAKGRNVVLDEDRVSLLDIDPLVELGRPRP